MLTVELSISVQTYSYAASGRNVSSEMNGIARYAGDDAPTPRETVTKMNRISRAHPEKE